MTKIIKILHTEIRTKEDNTQYLLTNVLLDDGTEGVAIVGGECEVFFHRGQVKVFVKRTQTLDKGVDVL